MKLSTLKNLFLFSVVMITQHFALATITIDSVSTIKSSCTNNGSATIFATVIPNGTLLYALVAGPALVPLQNNSTFASLFPGTYTVRVYDVNFDSAETQFSIAGNYQLPDFDLTKTDPTCPASNDGSITAIVDTNFGLAPYLYEMTSPNIIPKQAQNVFPNLNANTYLIRMTDACGNYQTRTAILSSTGTGITFNAFSVVPQLAKIGCDTMEMTEYFYMYKEKSNNPVTLTEITKYGTITKSLYPIVVDTIYNVPGLFKVVDTLVNITYGDSLQTTVTDVCGESIYSTLQQIAPYDFEILFQATTVNCVASFSAYLQLKQFTAYPFDNTTIMNPSSFVLIDLTTNLIVDSMTCGQFCALYLKPEIPGNFYALTVTDGCGQVWQDTIQWPTPGTPIVYVSYFQGCMDSTAVISFDCKNFQSAVSVTFLSGPTQLQSTKPHYQYSDVITYPKSFLGLYSTYVYIKDCPVGHYTFEVNDSCGNVIPGSIDIYDYMVSNLSYSWYVKPSCLNDNTLFFNFQQGSAGVYHSIITDVSDSTIVYDKISPPYYTDSLTTLPIGTYALELYYSYQNGVGGTYYDGSLADNLSSCWVLRDTISIVPYSNNSFVTNNTIYCNGINYVELIVDTLKGVPPYQFAIISGPQTFAQQDSGIFQIQLFGNYVVSIEDACGNNYTQQITLTSDSFPSIIKNGFLCAGNDVVLSAVSSSYFTYVWQYPNGTIYYGDSIAFHPFTVNDTGWYHITKIININGCNDTLYSDYYLGAGDSFPQSYAVCKGDSIFVGTNVYSVPGVYYDTLATSIGCDSVIVTTLSFIPALIDSVVAKICDGDSVIVGTNVYTVPGMYFDTLAATTGCDSILVTSLSFLPFQIDTNNTNICKNDSVVVGTNIYYLPGTYTDTVIDPGGCKKLLITNLTFNIIINIISTTICKGDSVSVGNNFYSLPGNYTDTLISALGCDSVVMLQLGNSIAGTSTTNAIICEGQNYAFGNNIYSQTGIFADTLTTINGCDSIAVLQLNVDPLPTILISASNDTIVTGDTLQLNCNNTQLPNYLWSGNANFSNATSANTTANIISAGWIYLSATNDNGCTNIDSVYIYLKTEDGDTCENALLFIPNVFTPNDDGKNDVFKILATNIQVHGVKIYNRWGQQVFNTNDASNGWNGLFNDGKCSQGVYYFQVEYESCIDGSLKLKYGSITLLE